MTRLGFLTRATALTRVEFVSELVTFVGRGEGRGELLVTPRETRLSDAERSGQRWVNLISALQPGDWRELTVAPGALLEEQLKLLQKQLPKTRITAAPSA